MNARTDSQGSLYVLNSIVSHSLNCTNLEEILSVPEALHRMITSKQTYAPIPKRDKRFKKIILFIHHVTTKSYIIFLKQTIIKLQPAS